MNAEVRTVGYCIAGLFGVILFMIGGSLIIWTLHILMWNYPSPDFGNNLPSDVAALYLVSTPLGLFLIGFSILLIIWSGVGFFNKS